MNKKLLMFMFVGIFGVMLVTAGLVNYLSNTIESEVNVESPISFTTANEEMVEVYGGEVFTTRATIVNNIEDEITGVFQATITNDLGNAACDDYQEITFDIIGGVTGEIFGIDLYDLPNMEDDPSYGCYDNEGITTIRVPVHYEPKEMQKYNMHLKFAQNVEPTNYNVEGQILIA